MFCAYLVSSWRKGKFRESERGKGRERALAASKTNHPSPLNHPFLPHQLCCYPLSTKYPQPHQPPQPPAHLRCRNQQWKHWAKAGIVGEADVCLAIESMAMVMVSVVKIMMIIMMKNRWKGCLFCTNQCQLADHPQSQPLSTVALFRAAYSVLSLLLWGNIQQNSGSGRLHQQIPSVVCEQ